MQTQLAASIRGLSLEGQGVTLCAGMCRAAGVPQGTDAGVCSCGASAPALPSTACVKAVPPSSGRATITRYALNATAFTANLLSPVIHVALPTWKHVLVSVYVITAYYCTSACAAADSGMPNAAFKYDVILRR